ncbi:MAG: hypothetical protein KDA55_03535 [Planctomycetales bacterium]|nr:hypothetical protein [Planctomycetales bacterium]
MALIASWLKRSPIQQFAARSTLAVSLDFDGTPINPKDTLVATLPFDLGATASHERPD